ncbi:MAG: hypothetical protein ABJH28_14135 [Paraglaciecola sp.]|uniref:hypothetical protein n=1 Tax=Paraglaciecola sp. TaxID=1920173 RepID=UPI003266721D
MGKILAQSDELRFERYGDDDQSVEVITFFKLSVYLISFPKHQAMIDSMTTGIKTR